MKSFRRQNVVLGISLALLQMFNPARAGAPPKEPVIAEIDGFCERAYEFGNQHEKYKRIFADVSGGVLPAQNEGRWREFSSAAALKKMAVSEGSNGVPQTQTRAWKDKEGVTFVEAVFTSDSGDWGLVVDYCYRPDGTLAYVEVTYNNLSTETRSWQERYFDNNGKLVKTYRKVFNLDTGRLISMKNFQEPSNPIYAHVKELPFFKLLSRASVLTAPKHHSRTPAPAESSR